MSEDTAITFDTVRQLALALPGVEESTSYGTARSKSTRNSWHACARMARRWQS